MNDENYETYFIQPSEIPLSHPNAHIDMVELIMSLITTMCRKLTPTEFNNWSYLFAVTLDRNLSPSTRLAFNFIQENGHELWSGLAAWRLDIGRKVNFDHDRAVQMALNVLQLTPPGFRLDIHSALLPDFRIPLTHRRSNLWRIYVDHQWNTNSEMLGTPYTLKEPYPMKERVRKHTGRHALLTGKNGHAIQTDLHVWSIAADTDDTPCVSVNTLVEAIQSVRAKADSYVSVLSIREDYETEKFSINSCDPWYPVTERLLKIEITDKAIDEICNKITHIAEKELLLVSPHLTSKGMIFYDSPVIEVNIESFWSLEG